jgi:DNA-binding NarL/FixJ family response regulator
MFTPHWGTETEGLNGSIALIKSSVLHEGIVRPLHATFPKRIVTYSTWFQIVSEPHERLPRLIMLGAEIANGTIESTIRSLSRLVPRIPTVVLASKDDEELARKVISLGAKAYVPVPTRCEVVAVVRFILTSAV